MKQLKPSPPQMGLSSGQGGGSTPALSRLKALRLAQKETNQRGEELKLRLFRLTEQHMDQAVRLMKRWLADKD